MGNVTGLLSIWGDVYLVEGIIIFIPFIPSIYICIYIYPLKWRDKFIPSNIKDHHVWAGNSRIDPILNQYLKGVM